MTKRFPKEPHKSMAYTDYVTWHLYPVCLMFLFPGLLLFSYLPHDYILAFPINMIIVLFCTLGCSVLPFMIQYIRMRRKQFTHISNEDFDQTFNEYVVFDWLFMIPSGLLIAYLPSAHMYQWLPNLVIILLFSFGFFHICQFIKLYFKRRKQ